MAETQAIVTLCAIASGIDLLCIPDKTVPFRDSTAHPPEPMVPAVRWAVPISWFHPKRLAVVPAAFLIDSLKVLVSCIRAKSSSDTFAMLSAAVAQQLGLAVRIDQSPCLAHQRSCSVDESSTSSGVLASSGNFLIAICLLVVFFFLFPLARRCRLARLMFSA